MKLIGIVSTAVLSLAIAAPVYAQQEQHDQEEQKDKPAEKKAQPEKSAKPGGKKRTAGEERQAGREECATAGEERQAGREECATTGEERQAGREKRPAARSGEEQQAGTKKCAAASQAAGATRAATVVAAFPTIVTRPTLDRQHTFRVSKAITITTNFNTAAIRSHSSARGRATGSTRKRLCDRHRRGVLPVQPDVIPGVNIALDVNL